MWPSVLVYARNGTPYQTQEDHFDTLTVNLIIEILCQEGPIKEEEVHKREGIELMELLDSQLHRLFDVVILCIKKRFNTQRISRANRKTTKSKNFITYD